MKNLYLKRKILYSALFFLSIIFFPKIIFAADLPQQIYVKTDETKVIGSGTCTLKTGKASVDGIITDGVCALPSDAIDASAAANNLSTNNCDAMNSNCVESLSDVVSNITGINVPTEVKTVAQTIQAAGTAFSIATLVPPLILILSSPQLYFSSFLLLFGNRKTKSWGFVYDSITKAPIPFATVKLYSSLTDEFIKDTVTDIGGHFSFLINRGKYYMQIKASGYKVVNKRAGKLTSDIYSGETIQITEDGVNVSLRVPVDALNSKISIFRKTITFLTRNFPKIIKPLLLFSFVFSLISLYLQTSILNLVVAVVYFLLYIFAATKKKNYTRSGGRVYDIATGHGIPLAFVRLYDPKTEDMAADLVLSDSNGRFELIADKGKYILEIELPGYSIKKTRNAKIISSNRMKVNYNDRVNIDIGVMENISPMSNNQPQTIFSNRSADNVKI